MSRRSGISLIEVLVVIWGLGIALSFGAVMLLAAMRTDQAAAANLQRLTQHAELANQFRADVASAVEAPERAGELPRSPTCLILKLPNEAVVIYLWQNDKFQRIERTADGERRRTISPGLSQCEVTFEKALPIVTMRIRPMLQGMLGLPLNISAALGGDRK